MAAYFSLDDQGVVEGALHDGRINQTLTGFRRYVRNPTPDSRNNHLSHEPEDRSEEADFSFLLSENRFMEFYPLSE